MIISFLMKKFKKVLRVAGLTLFIFLAACGLSITGSFLTGARERYMDKEIRTEQVDKKEEEDEDKT